MLIIIIRWPRLSRGMGVVDSNLCYWADYSLPSGTGVKNELICTLILPCALVVFAEQLDISLS
jgi:hypothetical protein